ncbi:ParD-like family protein [Nocardioides sp. LMS-CY]|uniref:ParD-like family protein n=1 Tax=Nocardioides sp. (strain LMS-CY) TaxID=2840457 RepID=UPI001BFFE13C|nr:ParD-like family protein [Nocardioides sp. LMS-CY]QWF20353.1 ParD-like family protein [Nocardioides sp. LMS-CY]
MATTTPTRFDADLFASAQVAGARSHRSAAQQLAHWARLGRELEAAGGVTQRDIDRVLAGQLSYDELGDRDQAVVRTSWGEGIEDDLSTLDLRSRFEAQGRRRWSEADADGTVTVHETTGDDVPTGPRHRGKRG